jgi:UDP-glucose 4-epimerase
MSAPPHGPALVTGASGFIGGHLLARLARDGCSVVGLDAAPPDPSAAAPPAGAEVLTVDIRDDEAVRVALDEVRPEVVYHLAAQASVAMSMRDPAADIEVNVLGSVRLARAAAEAGVRRFVFFSTGGAIYGQPKRIPVDEETPAMPLSVYGTSKLAAERYLGLLAEHGAFELSVLRPGNVYGPGQDSEGEAGVFAIFAARMLRAEPVTIFGDGSQGRDYVYVDDTVEAALLAATGKPATCVIGSGVATRTIEVFETLARLCDYDPEPVFADERPGDIQHIALDATRARSTWGWAPRVSLEQGSAATVEWFRAHPRAR